MEYYIVKTLLVVFILGCLYGVHWWLQGYRERLLLIPAALWFGAAFTSVAATVGIALYTVYWAFTFTGA